MGTAETAGSQSVPNPFAWTVEHDVVDAAESYSVSEPYGKTTVRYTVEPPPPTYLSWTMTEPAAGPTEEW